MIHIPEDVFWTATFGLMAWIVLQIAGLREAVARIEIKLGTKPAKKPTERKEPYETPADLSRAVESARNLARLRDRP